MVVKCAWTLQTKHGGRVDAMQMRIMRRIEGVTKLDKIRNVDLRDRLKQGGVLDLVKGRQQRWKQRLEEMDDRRITKRVYDNEIAGR